MAAPLTQEDLLEFLECARYGETEDVASYLDDGADINFTDGGGNTALHRASANGHVDTVRLLADRGATYKANSNGNSPLHWAAMNGHAAVVAVLLERWASDVDVLAKNTFGKSALSEAINHGHDDLARDILTHHSVDAGYQSKKSGGAGAGGGAGASGAGIEEGAGDDDEDDGDIEETEEDVGEDDQDLLDGGEGAGDGAGASGAGSGDAESILAPPPASSSSAQ